jgi:hypothetical protein|nr:hypothetical protein [Nitrosomonas nitrosa]
MLGWMLEKMDKERPGGGGGGKARIRFGNTGPRGRRYGSSKTPKGTPVIAKAKFIKVGKGSRPAIREHLRYIQERERGEGEPERKFFDRERQGIERKEVFEAMLEGRGDRAAMHTLILSPGDNGVDLEQYTRESMKALEERMGHELDWYATIHRNTDHHHAHVVIAGKIPDRERDLEKAYTKRWEREYDRDVERELSWKNREAELRELLGKGYDERAALDPREERRLEREFGYGSEREETDPRVKELIGDNVRSAEELKFERMIERYEWQMGAAERAKERGDVYLDRNDLKELRDCGNDYMTRERSVERSLERAFEREFGREMEPYVERDREPDRWAEFYRMTGLRDAEPEREPERSYDFESRWSDINQTFETDRFLEQETTRDYDRGREDQDDSFGRSRGDRGSHEDREDRGRDDDFGRGR